MDFRRVVHPIIRLKITLAVTARIELLASRQSWFVLIRCVSSVCCAANCYDTHSTHRCDGRYCCIPQQQRHHGCGA